ncbi:hypothetical protein CFOL_v3_33190 [Cephalotus follicularis]|uniref:Protein FAR1-RELATED SEQUENCE n=1 Tax=Cephalotus follicularis TaxID=3775 RepID=A0A1Q3DBB4_CEPFO|nr:hypothetical protein CFOL_v3_33190 [Cephalotus follicularis]
MFASRTSQKQVFIDNIEPIKRYNHEAHAYLHKLHPKHWSKHVFGTRAKTNCVVNNVAESFNAMILEARGLPIISMMEEIRKKHIVRIQERYTVMDRYDGIICPKIRDKLE